MSKLTFKEFTSTVNGNVILKELAQSIDYNKIDEVILDINELGNDDLIKITVSEADPIKPGLIINLSFSYTAYNEMDTCDKYTLTNIINTIPFELEIMLKESFPVEEQIIRNYMYAVKLGIDKVGIPQGDDDIRVIITSDTVSIYKKLVNELVAVPFKYTEETTSKEINNYLIKNNVHVVNDRMWAKGYLNGSIEYLKDGVEAWIDMSNHEGLTSVYERKLDSLNEIQELTNKLF